ncbi:PA2169 family four-helix-bundle protein [Glaciecola sp. MF2-115]|uniref:PA2169 family four-helix-bundle protein n=1 Tax=Glaciecola sp. MF2-115 TaxID=3384827 RepID=UPI0039A17259
MSNVIKHASNISDIVKVLQGGVEFYEEAVQKVDSPNIRSTFSKMIKEKTEAIEKLQPFIINKTGSREEESHWMVSTRQAYTKVLSAFTSDEEHTYVKQLEEVEDKVLEVLDEAMAEDQPASCTLVLREMRARAQQLHDEMKALQEATA